MDGGSIPEAPRLQVTLLGLSFPSLVSCLAQDPALGLTHPKTLLAYRRVAPLSVPSSLTLLAHKQCSGPPWVQVVPPPLQPRDPGIFGEKGAPS